jgi:hypothetical protein
MGKAALPIVARNVRGLIAYLLENIRNMRCPHCLTSFFDDPDEQNLGSDRTSSWRLFKRKCPECGRFILSLDEKWNEHPKVPQFHPRVIPCYPKAVSRVPLGPEVPEEFTEDYREACLTLPDSPKASAALSRRCLQHLLRDEAKVKPGSLSNEIQQVLDSGKLPSYLAESLDAVRNIGNFAAHPTKSKASGEIIDVEPGEAEWNLDVLESLFDFYFTQPALLKKKREALNAKLKEAGKREMKAPQS